MAHMFVCVHERSLNYMWPGVHHNRVIHHHDVRSISHKSVDIGCVYLIRVTRT